VFSYCVVIQEPLHRENQIRVRKIFVGGLKETTDEPILSEYFSQFGHVDHVDLIEDRTTKRLRGFAYVTFNDYDPVDKAVCKDIILLNTFLICLSFSLYWTWFQLSTIITVYVLSSVII